VIKMLSYTPLQDHCFDITEHMKKKHMKKKRVNICSENSFNITNRDQFMSDIGKRLGERENNTRYKTYKLNGNILNNQIYFAKFRYNYKEVLLNECTPIEGVHKLDDHYYHPKTDTIYSYTGMVTNSDFSLETERKIREINNLPKIKDQESRRFTDGMPTREYWLELCRKCLS
jgi:hypothetical protein